MVTLPDHRLKIDVVSADGGAVQRLVPGNGEEGVPTWSSEGKQIVFGEPLHRNNLSAMKLHIIDLKTHQVSDIPGSEGLWTARWSPDGRTIAALHLRETSTSASDEIRLYDVSLRKWRDLTHVEGIEEPTWSRDGSYLYFNTAGEGPALYRVGVRDGKLERLADLSEVTCDLNWSGVTPEGSPLISGIKQMQEIYALDMDWP